MNRAAVVAQIAAASIASEIRTGCPAAVSFAQCGWESGWLQKMPTGSNNCFGIKDTDRFPGSVYVMTTEWRSGKLVPERHAFEVYRTLEACFEDHGRLLTRGIYAPAWKKYVETKDLDAWVRAFSPIYAPGNLKYAANILGTARSPECLAALKLAQA